MTGEGAGETEAAAVPALGICPGCRQVVGLIHSPVECGTTQLQQQAAARKQPRTWPVVECDQNTSPHLFDVVTPEVAEQMPPGTEVIIAFTDRQHVGDGGALTWGYAALGAVTDQKPTGDGGDVVVYVQPYAARGFQ